MLTQGWQALAGRAVNTGVLYHCVAVDQEVAEGDDLACIRDAGREVGIEFGQLAECFADDLELALDRRLHER